jgi:hypothetical protein
MISLLDVADFGAVTRWSSSSNGPYDRPVAQSISVYSAIFMRLLTAGAAFLDRCYRAGLANGGQ